MTCPETCLWGGRVRILLSGEVLFMMTMLRETHWPLFLCPPRVSGQPVMGHGCVSDCTCGILWKEEFTTYLSGGSDSKECACKAGNLGLIPGSGRSPGGGHGNPLQYSCLENPMDGGAWRATVMGLQESDTTEWLSTHAVNVDAIGVVWKGLLCSVRLSLACEMGENRAISPTSVVYYSF